MTTHFLKVSLSLLLLLCPLFISPIAYAGEEGRDAVLKGRVFTIQHNAETSEFDLVENDEVITSARFLHVLSTHALEDHDIAVIEINHDTRYCGGYPALLMVAPSGARDFIELPDLCTPFDISEVDGVLHLSYEPRVGNETPYYIFSPSIGLQFDRMVAYSPAPGTGWEDIIAEPPSDVKEAIANEVVYFALRDMMGQHFFTEFMRSARLEFPPAREGDLLLIGGCGHAMCHGMHAYMVIDLSSRLIYAMLMEEPDAIFFWPRPFVEWPEPVRAIVEKWSE